MLLQQQHLGDLACVSVFGTLSAIQRGWRGSRAFMILASACTMSGLTPANQFPNALCRLYARSMPTMHPARQHNHQHLLSIAPQTPFSRRHRQSYVIHAP